MANFEDRQLCTDQNSTCLLQRRIPLLVLLWFYCDVVVTAWKISSENDKTPFVLNLYVVFFHSFWKLNGMKGMMRDCDWMRSDAPAHLSLSVLWGLYQAEVTSLTSHSLQSPEPLVFIWCNTSFWCVENMKRRFDFVKAFLAVELHWSFSFHWTTQEIIPWKD